MKEYVRRMDAENSKYFTQGLSQIPDSFREEGLGFTSGLDLKNKYYSFLTPAVTRIGPNKLKTTNRSVGLYAPKQYNSIVTIALALNPNSTRPMNSILAKAEASGPEFVTAPPIPFAKTYNAEVMEVDKITYETNIASTFALSNLNCQVMTVSDWAQEQETILVRSNVEDDEKVLVDPVRVLGEETKFITFTAEEDQAVEENTNDSIEGDKDLAELASVILIPVLNSSKGLYGFQTRVPTITKLDPRTEDNIIDQFFGTFSDGSTRKLKFISELPNQVKSLLLSNSKIAKQNWFKVKREKGRDLVSSPEQSGIFYLLYQHINQIEVQVGYKTDALNNPIVSSPIYKPMSKKLFDAINKGNSLVVCRMVPYKNNLFDFKKSEKMKLPEFDTHFLLGPMDTLSQIAAEEDVATESMTETYESVVEEAFEKRLTQYLPLSTTGNKILVNILKTISDQDQIPPEFTSTAFIQQPYTATRVGTRFSTKTKARTDQSGKSGVGSALKTRTTSQTTGVSKIGSGTTTGGMGGTSGGGSY